jgi:hypothetical protein
MARQHSQSRRHTDQVRNKIIDLTCKIHLKKSSDKPILTSNFEDSTSIARSMDMNSIEPHYYTMAQMLHALQHLTNMVMPM